MRRLRSLMLVLPSALMGALLMASLTGVARAQGNAGASVGRTLGQAMDRRPPQPPPVRPARFNDAWEYDYYFCGTNDPCATDHFKGAYDELDRRGSEGWEAYGYHSTPNVGYDWELKRRL